MCDGGWFLCLFASPTTAASRDGLRSCLGRGSTLFSSTRTGRSGSSNTTRSLSIHLSCLLGRPSAINGQRAATRISNQPFSVIVRHPHRYLLRLWTPLMSNMRYTVKWVPRSHVSILCCCAGPGISFGTQITTTCLSPSVLSGQIVPWVVEGICEP